MNRKPIFFTFFLIVTFAGRCFADVRLPSIISDSMVLQRNTPLTIWGWADAGEHVTIHFNKNIYQADAGPNGKWSILMPPQTGHAALSMSIDGHNHIDLRNIVLGDVWLCSGQSNMVLPMERVKEKYGDEIARSGNFFIRQFLVPMAYNFNGPKEDMAGARWVSSDPQSVLQFGAVGYFFAEWLFRHEGVPIGIINASVGGTPVQAWMSPEALTAFPMYAERTTPFKSNDYITSVQRNDAAAVATWTNTLKSKDAGLNGPLRWYDSAYSPEGWRDYILPGYWPDEGLPPGAGVCWFRKEVKVPLSMAGKPAKLFLGRMVDADETYVNGRFVGNITYQYPPRRYEVPAGVLHEGLNTITVRLVSNGGRGGFVPDKPYYLAAGGDTIDLKGSWQAKSGTVMTPLRTSGITVQYQPEGLFNGMIAPLIPYAIKGAAWYQGEANTDHPSDYSALLTAMIGDWRTKWKTDFPFLIVQLPNFGEAASTPGESNWARLREQQAQAARFHNTALVVTIDIGEWNDIHPLNKKDVGERLGRAAARLAYGSKKGSAYSPVYQSMRVEGSRVLLNFSSDIALRANGDTLKGFTVAGSDRRFVPATATLKDKQVTVWNESITQPTAVRYAWADNPQGANLYDKYSLPASPFRTDTFPQARSFQINSYGWRKGTCAVVLTYDDALSVHLDNALPLLDSLNLKATFYVSGYSGVLKARLNEWRAAALEGHELGNHTLFHPCAGNLPGRSFVTPDYDLSKYSLTRMVDEMRMTNALLEALDGRRQRSFAYPCGDTLVGDSAYIHLMKNEFTGARGVYPALKKPRDVDLYNINCYSGNGQSGEELIAEVQRAMASHSLLVFLFHGVGGGHGLNISLEAHRKLLIFLQQHQSEIWVAPMTEVASYIKDYQQIYIGQL